MSKMFLQIPAQTGSATEANHKGQIPVEYFGFKNRRYIQNKVGQLANREGGLPSFGEVELVLNIDPASVDLFQYYCTGKTMPQAKIDICNSGNNLQPYSIFTLYNVFVSHYEERYNADAHKRLFVALNYSKIDKRFISTSSDNKLSQPTGTGYDLEKAQLS